jgi:uncharacterized protein YigE (DUF2233 family)
MIRHVMSVALSAVTFGMGAVGVFSLQRGLAQAPDKPCDHTVFEGDGFLVCRFDPRQNELLLTTKARRLPQLAKAMGGEANHVLFAMNAGMFDISGAPIGLLVENGKQKHAVNLKTGAGNFYMKPNGVFWIEAGAVHVAATDAYVAGNAKSLWATQSGPMLVTAGKLHPNFDADGASRNVRNAVGVKDAHTALFVISDKPVSFGKLARFFRDDLKCADALYLDGAVSSLWMPDPARAGGGRMDDAHDLGPLLVVSAAE